MNDKASYLPSFNFLYSLNDSQLLKLKSEVEKKKSSAVVLKFSQARPTFNWANFWGFQFLNADENTILVQLYEG
ncbi:MAG: hypothetical protein Q4G09_06275 [Clostridia bacterium]|nr:hypothetical protein [Clostridia bacterium]